MKFSKLSGEIARYLLVGGVAVLIDAAVYTGIVTADILTPEWAKRVSFIVGSIWAFFANKYFTFRQKRLHVREPFLFAAVYVSGFLLNSFVHDVVLRLTLSKPLSFLCATATSTIWNYLGQKFLVFRSIKKRQSDA